MMEIGFKNSVKDDPFIFSGSSSTSSEYWRFGSNNLFPYALARLSRGVPTHRRILNDKRNYIMGKGFTTEDKRLEEYIKRVNHSDNLFNVLSNVVYDRNLIGNGYIEIVTNNKRSFLSLFHQDATKCRLAKDKRHILLHHDWTYYNKSEAKQLPIYPLFEQIDGYLRSIIVFKSYEPMFENYGIPDYISGLNVSSIAYKTDKWNLSRLDNSFQLSGVMELDADEVDEEKAKELKEKTEKKFAGKPGQVLVLVKNMVEQNRGTKFTPIASTNEGDWISLHDLSTTDIVIGHSWFRELSGLDFAKGFSSDAILHAYEIAKNTVIMNVQEEIINPVKRVISDILGYETESLSFVNKPPLTAKPEYMMVWEARKADGLDYDENDPEQKKYLAQLKNVNNSK